MCRPIQGQAATGKAGLLAPIPEMLTSLHSGSFLILGPSSLTLPLPERLAHQAVRATRTVFPVLLHIDTTPAVGPRRRSRRTGGAQARRNTDARFSSFGCSSVTGPSSHGGSF